VGAQGDRRAGRRKAAEVRLRAALASLEAIGAAGWAARAREDLARLGIQPGDATELTPSEDRIARLAAAGLRNREIATRLFISPKTVEASLARAYDKLGVRSRMELAPALAARDRADGTAETAGTAG
jgi:DNA-binding NarL/FixJ family response regulator